MIKNEVDREQALKLIANFEDEISKLEQGISERREFIRKYEADVKVYDEWRR